MRNWDDVLPANIAASQRHYEKCYTAYRMRLCGFTYRQIAEHFNVSRERVRQLEANYIKLYVNKNRRTPIELWFSKLWFWD